MRDVTLCFLVKEKDNQVRQICLAIKKRGWGVGRWNGVGGKVRDEEETIEEAVIREAQEEIGVEIKDLRKVGEITFIFPNDKQQDQLVHVYLVKEWAGEPRESEEMCPGWFAVEEIPFDSMWPDDIHWLPKVLRGDKIKAKFLFEGESVILDHHVATVSGF